MPIYVDVRERRGLILAAVILTAGALIGVTQSHRPGQMAHKTDQTPPTQTQPIVYCIIVAGGQLRSINTDKLGHTSLGLCPYPGP
jgi:hypothetical protein